MIYNNFQSMTEFKVDMHDLYTRARKDLEHSWVTLLFLAIDDAIYVVLAAWPLELRAPEKVVLNRLIAQKQKKEFQQRLIQLVEKTR